MHANLHPGVLAAIERQYPDVAQPLIQNTHYIRCKLWDHGNGGICCKYMAVHKIPMNIVPRSEAYTLLCTNINNQLCVNTYMRDFGSLRFSLIFSYELLCC